MDIKATLLKVYQINLADAQQLVKLYSETGDRDNLQRAQDDLQKWQTKLAAAQATIGAAQ